MNWYALILFFAVEAVLFLLTFKIIMHNEGDEKMSKLRMMRIASMLNGVLCILLLFKII
jgi:hypothetical protein